MGRVRSVFACSRWHAHSLRRPEIAARFGMCADESGLALVVTLAAILVMLTVSATLVAVARNEYRLAAVAQTSRQAVVAAEAGLERGLFEVRRDPDWTDSTGATALNAGPSWYPLCLAPNGVPPCAGATAVDLPFPTPDPSAPSRSNCPRSQLEVRPVATVRRAYGFGRPGGWADRCVSWRSSRAAQVPWASRWGTGAKCGGANERQHAVSWPFACERRAPDGAPKAI